MALIRKLFSFAQRDLMQSRREGQHQQVYRFWRVLQSHVNSNVVCCQLLRTSSPQNLRIVQAVPYDAHGVRIVYSDGTKSDFRYVWLRDCCQCPECHDRDYKFRRFDTSTLDIDIRPTAMWVTDEGHLGAKWPHEKSEHKSIFRSDWLQRYGQAFRESNYAVARDVSYRPDNELWDRSSLEKRGLPQMSYEPFISTSEGLKEWMDYFYKYGFVILRDVPLTREALLDVANRLAYIRPTSFGHTSDVKIGPQSSVHPVYTGTAFDLHTDLTYRERSPGIMMLHFMQAADPETVGTDAGGQTLLADGYFVAKWIKQKYPSYFQTLTRVPVPYGYKDPISGLYYTAYWPVIGINPVGDVQEIHHSPFARQPLQMPGEEVLSFYEALVEFCKKLRNSHVPFYLRQGDLLSINNRRVLHARTAFDPNRVARYTRTCYLDLDEVLYKYDSILYYEAKERELQERD